MSPMPPPDPEVRRLMRVAIDLKDALHLMEQELRRRNVDYYCYVTGTHPTDQSCSICDSVKR